MKGLEKKHIIGYLTIFCRRASRKRQRRRDVIHLHLYSRSEKQTEENKPGFLQECNDNPSQMLQSHESGQKVGICSLYSTR